MTTESGEKADLGPQDQRRLSPDRLMAFTDGVFAIIITILVLEVKVPDLGSGQSLGAALAETRPTVLAFVISFLLVGMYWTWHRAVFAQVRYVDNNAVWLNLLFLLPVSLVPFAAGTIGEYSSEPSALHLYGAVLTVVTLLRSALNAYLVRHPELLWVAPTRDSKLLSGGTALAPIVVYGIAMAVASWAPWLSLLLYLALPLLYFVLIAVLRSVKRTRSAAVDLG